MENIFPPISELPTILTEGIKYGFGCFILSLLAYVIPISIISFIGFLCSISFLEQKSFVIGGLIIITTVVLCIAAIFSLMYFFILPLCIMYLKSLDFSYFFAFNKTKKFRMRKGNQVFVFLLFSILIGIIVNILSSLVTLITKFAGIIQNVPNADFYSGIITTLTSLILYTLIMPNLNGQIARYNVADEMFVENYEDYYDKEEDDDEYDESQENIEEDSKKEDV